MTYDAFETGEETGTPVEIYKFTLGTTTYFLTSAEDDQTVSSQVYTALAGLQRTTTAEGATKREHEFKVDLPTSHALAQIFVGTMPGVRVQLEVSRFHREDISGPEVILIFRGNVHSASFSSDFATTTLASKTELAGIGRLMPRRKFMASCNHVLYDTTTCQVDDTSSSFKASSLSVASVSGITLTLDSGLSGTFADGFMTGGFVEDTSAIDFRLIILHVGNVLTIHQPFAVTPSTVDVFAGCDHSIGICSSKFDNVDRFGGFAFVPKRNIFKSGIV